MACCPSCPYCKPQYINDVRDIMYTDEWRTQFFQNVEKVKCPTCYTYFYITNSTSYDYDNAEYIRSFSLTQEEWKVLNQEFNNNRLVNYLPNDTFKTRYQDSKKILQIDVSSEAKMATIRPLIECFLNAQNNIADSEKIRLEIKNLENKQLHSSLHKIVDDTLKGVHVKEEVLKNDPKYVLELLEALFTKIYLMPIEEEKIKQKFNDEQLKLEENLQNLLNNLK